MQLETAEPAYAHHALLRLEGKNNRQVLCKLLKTEF